MDVYDITFIIFIFVLAIIYIVYFLAFFYIFSKRSKKRKTIRSFFNILDKLSNHEVPFEEKMKQLIIDYDELFIARDYQFMSLVGLLEYVIFKIDSNEIAHLITNQSILNNIESIRQFVIKAIDYEKRENPFDGLPEKEAFHLKSILISSESNDSKSIKHSLKELASEIESKELLFKKQSKITTISIIVSIVGIVLTVLFGILSFIR